MKLRYKLKKLAEVIVKEFLGKPRKSTAQIELEPGHETKEVILEHIRAERELNSAILIWSLDAKDSFYKFLVSLDLVILGFLVALTASNHLHPLVTNWGLFKWGVRIMVFHLLSCLVISSLWPRAIQSESGWRYERQVGILSQHIKLQNRFIAKRISGEPYKNEFTKIEESRLNLFDHRPAIYNRLRIATFPWLWLLILTISLVFYLVSTKLAKLV